jgi:hypothetical protein
MEHSALRTPYTVAAMRKPMVVEERRFSRCAALPVRVRTKPQIWVVKRGWPPGLGVAIRVIGVRRCPTLPQGPPCSTIGAESLSFRVRNVTGRFPLAMAAETLEMYLEVSNRHQRPTRCSHGCEGWVVLCVFGSRPYIENHIVDASACVASYEDLVQFYGVIKLSTY